MTRRCDGARPAPGPARAAAATTLVVLAIAALLAGCGRVPADVDLPPTPTATEPAGSTGGTGNTGSTGGAAASSGDEDASLGFDEIASYDDGVEVEISGTVAEQAGPGVTGAESTNGQLVAVTVLLRNDSTTALDASRVLVTASSGPAYTDAPLVTDPSGRLANAFLGTVTAGAETSTDYGFAVPASALGRITVTVDLGDGRHEPVSFTGPIERGRLAVPTRGPWLG